ncbi:MAG: MraY family glycosyltransferase [Planctomycetota bacterium]|nr:MraY family glycosyltransferase [Planctomycetota bacterium]
MKTYAGIFLLSLLLAALLTPVARALAIRLGAMDRPGRRKVHRGAVPRLGGIAIYAAFFLPLLSLLLISNTVTAEVATRFPEILGILVGSTIILAVGVADDLRGWSPWIKLPIEIVAAVVVYKMGVQITHVTNPFGDPIAFGAASPVITVIWIVGITNAINLIDGIDGLAAGVTAFAAIALFICALALNNVVGAVLVIGLAGAILGFLQHNFHPARIFMGDSGSLFVGFTLASLSILGSLKSSAVVAMTIPVLIFGLPIADTTFAAARRFFRGRPIFRGDDEHIHHTLLRQGFTQRQSSLILYSVTAFLGGVAILITYNNTREIGIGFLVAGFLGAIVFRRILLARGNWRSRSEGPAGLRQVRKILFDTGKALKESRGEPEAWESIRAAAEALGYLGAHWSVDLGVDGPSERSWGTNSDAKSDWDLGITLALGDLRGEMFVNRPAGSTMDFDQRDTVLLILCDLAAEQLLVSLSSGAKIPSTPRPMSSKKTTVPETGSN